MTWVWTILALLVLILLSLFIWQWTDRQVDQRVWRELVTHAGPPQAVFELAMLEGLPEPAQRFFRYTIKPGTPLTMAVEIDMHGELGLGSKDKPNYQPMQAQQILAPPHGLVWQLKSGAISGSDGASPQTSWTRFWLFNLIPLVRVGGNPDHHRSAFGRVVAESAFWVPASLLPAEHVHWEPVDQTTARAIVSYVGLQQAVAVTVAKNGQPTRVEIARWSNENPAKLFREQPFGGELSEFRDFGGYTLPTRVIGGNHIGTEDYFPFYKAEITAIRYPNDKVQQ